MPVRLLALNLIVKYGLRITAAEGQCMWAIKHLLPSVLFPEVDGWYRDQGESLIYMQLMDGITLADAWPGLEIEEKAHICANGSHLGRFTAA